VPARIVIEIKINVRISCFNQGQGFEIKNKTTEHTENPALVIPASEPESRTHKGKPKKRLEPRMNTDEHG
jgi:hypothetical protein